MEAQVAPVVRGEFVYRDVLFVDVGGEGKRHTRASPSEIKDLLNGKAAKDQVGHWYEAQLIHYGLQRSKEKNTAKVRLQQALGKNALSVPPHIVDLEGQMKEYAAAVRKAKAQAKGGKDPSTPAPSAIQQKRKANEESHGTAATKKGTTRETAKVKAAPKNATPAKSGGKSAGAKPAAQEAKAKSFESTKAGSKTDQNPPVKATPSKAKDGSHSSAQSATTAKAKAAPKTKAEQNVKDAKADSKTKAEPNVKAEPKVKSETKVKKEPVMRSAKANAIKSEPFEDHEDMYTGCSFQQMLETRSVTGVYDLWCPQTAEQLPEEADKLRLFLLVNDGKLWGGFELAMKTGVILAESLAYAGDCESVSFGWRTRDRWDKGRLRFGKGCFGDITLVGQYQVRATFHNLFPGEPIVVEGRRRSGPLWCGRRAYNFEVEWDGFVKETYG
ncbi:hypothetical protein EJ03DRAFT_372476 [Teratosphaeria nubilosa]|uniref:Uncharacterized protein n=1 Tax=Teratosphaeria nubilosa TaxID=161662 RepID=A0A6G1LH60_9PEZI|nr:hypothetical protein EJ03DRAFT_372476 [Teratosphaeria nubilosa]